MRVKRNFRSNETVKFSTSSGEEIVIDKDTYCLELDDKVIVCFAKGIQQYYDFIANPNYYQTNDVLIHNIMNDDDAIVYTVDDDVTFEDKAIYSVIIFRDIVFIMEDV